MIRPKSATVQSEADLPDSLVVKGDGRVTVGRYSRIAEFVVLDTGNGGAGKIEIGERVNLKQGCIIRTHGGVAKIGHRVSIGEYCIIAAHGGISIGQYSILGPYVLVNAASHNTGSLEAIRFQGEKAQGIEISENVWIGARATILDGVKIGANTVIGAHSLVNKSMPSGVVAFGLPARVIK